jgi:predicted nuclease with RNAse H fold
MMQKAIDILKKTIVGIDYGSKYAGTTVICYNSAHQVRFIPSSKNVDADSFLLTELTFLDPDLVMIDAPLSLPGVFWLGNGYSDHFFRKCDKEVRAMSPMFLGGLTARAMSLKKCMNGMGNKMLETYPRRLVEELGLPRSNYKNKKGDLPVFVDHLVRKLGVRINSPQLISWHHVDALLAFLSGIRYLENRSSKYGLPEEGIIVV